MGKRDNLLADTCVHFGFCVCACWHCGWGQFGSEDQEAPSWSVGGMWGGNFTWLVGTQQWISGDHGAAGCSPWGLKGAYLSFISSVTICLNTIRESDERPVFISTSAGNVLLKCILRNNWLFFSLIPMYYTYRSLMCFCSFVSLKQKPNLSFLCNSLDSGITQPLESLGQGDITFPQSPPIVRGTLIEILVQSVGQYGLPENLHVL